MNRAVIAWFGLAQDWLVATWQSTPPTEGECAEWAAGSSSEEDREKSMFDGWNLGHYSKINLNEWKKTHSEVHTLPGEEVALHRLQHYLKLEKGFEATAWTLKVCCKAMKRNERAALQAALTFIPRKGNSVNTKV